MLRILFDKKLKKTIPSEIKQDVTKLFYDVASKDVYVYWNFNNGKLYKALVEYKVLKKEKAKNKEDKERLYEIEYEVNRYLKETFGNGSSLDRFYLNPKEDKSILLIVRRINLV